MRFTLVEGRELPRSKKRKGRTMQTVTKTILASLALVGTVAAVAPAANAQGYGYGQPYGYEPYGSQDQGYNRYGEHYVCGRNLAKVTNFIIDPANGRPITQAEY